MRVQRSIFVSASLLCVVLFGPRAWDLRLLYLDSSVRARVQEGLQRVSEEHGWLLSDLIVTHVMRGGARFLHRAHIRGRDPEECFAMDLSDFVLTPCDAR